MIIFNIIAIKGAKVIVGDIIKFKDKVIKDISDPSC